MLANLPALEDSRASSLLQGIQGMWSAPEAEDIDQQDAEKEQQRDGAEKEPHEVRFTLFVPPREAVVGDDGGNDEKYKIQSHFWHTSAKSC